MQLIMLPTTKEIMKKLLNKIRKRDDLPPPSRMTSETIDEHREHILAGGRRFKYPLQYARHKLVINAILISLSAVIIALVIAWWQLYPAQNTSDFMYRLTKVIPVPVAVVDGQPVLYSDYLMTYRSSVYFSEQKQQLNTKTDDGKKQTEYFKQQSMQESIEDAYAKKMSKSLGASVSDSELESFIEKQRQSSDGEISEQVYDTSTLDFLGLTPSEYRHKISNGLLRQKVIYAIDKEALKTANYVYDVLQKDPKTDFKTLADTASKQFSQKVVYGASGWVPKTNLDGGLAIQASKLSDHAISPIIKSTQGSGYYYYIVRLLSINNTQVSYDYINIQLSAFSKALEKIEKSGKISRYISVSKIDSTK